MALTIRRIFFFFFFICFLIFHVNGQTQSSPSEGFINLNCGGDKTNVLYSSDFPMTYIPDDAYVETGNKEEVRNKPSNAFNNALLSTKRSFPGGKGTRGCYRFNVTKGLSILLRAYFYYGGLSDDSSPQFDVYLGVNYWATITPLINKLKIIHFPSSKYLHLCLLNTGNGDPYINYIELRPIGAFSSRIYSTDGLGSLIPYHDDRMGTSWKATDDQDEFIRYSYDMFDREWYVLNMNYSNITQIDNAADKLTNQGDSESENYHPPWKVVSTTVIDESNTDIVFDYSVDTGTRIYVVLHFAELVQDVTRSMEMKACYSDYCDEPMALDPPKYLQVSSHHYVFDTPINISIFSTSESLPIVNAIEEYTIKLFQLNETNDDDVDAILAIKDEYNATFTDRKWQWIGDPCNQTWSGITCTYNGNDPPRINELNLSSLGLNGTIPPALAKLTMLEKLDLSLNHLTGTVPDFLSTLQNLNFISIEGNNMTGPWPAALRQKQDKGAIYLKGSFQSNSHSGMHIGVIIAIAISIVVALICFSLVAFLTLKSRKKSKQDFTLSPPYTERESDITPKLKLLTLYEVNNLIHDNRVLGKGGFGTVYLSSIDGNYVAVKILDECNEKQAKDFKSEVEILATVHHKNLVQILGYCNHKEKRAIVMEYVENHTLKHHLSAKNLDGVLSWDTRVDIIIGAAQGLEYLHHGCKPPIIHRDIKPENILLTKDFEAKLADFGFSRLLTSEYNTSRLVGTHGYLDNMCLESLDKADIYSFGIVFTGSSDRKISHLARECGIVPLGEGAY